MRSRFCAFLVFIVLVSSPRFARSQTITIPLAGIGQAEYGGVAMPDGVVRSLRLNVRKAAALPRHTTSAVDSAKAWKGGKPLVQGLDGTEADGLALPGIDIGTCFGANDLLHSTPVDNSIAVSDEGWVVSVGNEDIAYHDAFGTSFGRYDWDDFLEAQQPTANIYDPRILFDHRSHRFILVVLHGSSSLESRIMVCFSKSSDPRSGWNIYVIRGNALRTSCWFDFPSIAVSGEDFYLCGNMFNDSDGFESSVILQIDKTAAFASTSPRFRYWTPTDVGTIAPASWGLDGGYGPGIYCVSTLAKGGTTVHLWDVTEDFSGSPELKRTTITVPEYRVPYDGYQKGTDMPIATNDCRALSTFYLNGILHFVHHDRSENLYTRLRYNRLDTSEKTVHVKTFGLDGYEYCYPSLVSYGDDQNDATALIAFLRSGSNIYPEFRCVAADESMDFTGSALIRAGDASVTTFASEDSERWGDFTGVARRFGVATPEAWASGCYGRANRRWGGWVAQISNRPTGGTRIECPELFTANLYPNPTNALSTIRFTTQTRKMIEIHLYDPVGRKSRLMYRDRPKAGVNEVRLFAHELRTGVYHLVITSEGKEIAHEKLIVVH